MRKKGFGVLPHIRQNREYESPIGQYRVAMGLTIKELAEKCDEITSVICGYQNGTILPYYIVGNKNKGIPPGTVRPSAEKLCEIFNVKLSDLFPRYICDIERYNGPENRTPFTKSQLEDIYGSFQYVNTEELEKKVEVREILTDVLARISPRKEAVIRKRFYEDMTLEEVGNDFCLSRDRIRQIEGRALMEIRRFLRSQKGKDALDEIRSYFPDINF
jgi:RNA polymerase sigma factor (sigma-70 family)